MSSPTITPRKIRVAAVQMACELAQPQKNLSRATAFVEEAAASGAKLILLPELMPGGYTLTEAIWDTAEPFDGTTTRWLRATAKRLRAFIGTSFVEADGEDFYNTFVLASPQGEIAGRVRKNPPASFEAYFFRAGADRHWIDTPIGRIGVGICYENALYERYAELQDAGIDLYLRPFSGASFQAKFPIRQKDVEFLNSALRAGTAETARVMGIPVVMSNKIGRLVTTLPAGFPSQDVEFPGFSAVADSDGRLLSQLASGREGVAAGDVILDPTRKAPQRVAPIHGRWTTAVPWWAAVWRLTRWMGERSYRTSEVRRLRARSLAH
jgi:N-carbamoylputrescine amidase